MSNDNTSNIFNVRSPHDEHNNVPDEFTHKLVIGPKTKQIISII
jgi:hypothetical protein